MLTRFSVVDPNTSCNRVRKNKNKHYNSEQNKNLVKAGYEA